MLARGGPYRADRVYALTRSDLLFKIHGLQCARPRGAGGADFSGCSGDCSDKAGTYLGREFARCPMREALDDQRLVQARLYRNQLALGMTLPEPVAWLSQLALQLESEDQAAREESRS